MDKEFDVIVIGGGIVGRLTAWHLGKMGKRILLLEQHNINKPKGGSRGISRMFGETFKREIYFKLASRSKDLWRKLESETGQELLHLKGGLDIFSGRSAQGDIKDLVSVFDSRKISYEILDADSLRRRYPQWKCDQSTQAIYSPNGGILEADRCMKALTMAIEEEGVIIKDQSRVINIKPSFGTVWITTSSGNIYRTEKLIIAAGPWMPNILKRFGLNLPLKVSQEQTVYFSPRSNPDYFESENFPVWEWDCEDFVYGFPMFEREGIKVAFHSDGHYLKNPGEFRRTPSARVTKRLRSFLEKHLPDATGEDFEATTCMYTNTPDEDFVIDRIPGIPQIGFFTGDSGHAFHCAPAVSEALSELVIHGGTSIDISCFSSNRFRI